MCTLNKDNVKLFLANITQEEERIIVYVPLSKIFALITFSKMNKLF